MNSFAIRKKFLDFFEKRGHKIVPSSSLIPKDPSVLFTSAGMQQFKSYFLGEESPFGKNVASCQKCFRTSDIDEVGDATHLTFFEMLGNFSFGAYFKEEAIKLAYDFIFKELKLPLNQITITVFEGDKDVPFDEESFLIWKKFGILEKNIKKGSRKDNFWGPTGEEGPCGPTTEIHCGAAGNLEKSAEIWNLVFNEFYCDKDKKLSPLKQKGVDTGAGLERLAMVLQDKKSVFDTDLFLPIISEAKQLSSKENMKAERIIADHIKASAFLIAEGILPSNIEQGYVLRRLLRRSIRYARVLELEPNWFSYLVKKIGELYSDVYPELKSKETDILTIIQREEEKFEKTLEKGIRKFQMLAVKGDIKGIDAFHLYDTYGFPLELTIELAKEKALKVDEQGFQKAFKKHQEISRAGAEKKFGGLGMEKVKSQSASWRTKVKIIALHTATHLLHQALRDVLGSHVKQMGSDINAERLRFDFSHSEKMTPEQIEKVEEIVNRKIGKNLPVKKEEMLYSEAIKSGALAFFREKYPEKVKVYSIGEYSREICAGPHVKSTGELGKFEIISEKSSSAGVRRIKAVLINR